MTSSAINGTPRAAVSRRTAGQYVSGATMPLEPAFGSTITAATRSRPNRSMRSAIAAAACSPHWASLVLPNGHR